MNGAMIADLESYKAYRESGMDWLGEVPAHWEVVRGKNLWKCVDVRSATGEEELLTVSSERGVLPRATTSVTMFRATSYVGHKLCWPGDLVINSLWAWAGGLGVSQYHGIVSTAYGVYRLRSFCQQDLRYLHKLLRSRPFEYELRVRSKGVWTSRLQLTDTAFLETPISLPPLDEQVAIARFLDWVGERVRRLVEAKEKLVGLLEELRASMISEAVQGRIDVRTGQPYPSYKPSGIDGIGNVPTHWEMSRVKAEFECLNHRRIPLSSIDRGRMHKRKYDYYGASGVIDKVDGYLFDDELLLIAEDGANLVLRNSPLAITAIGKFWVNNHAHVLKPLRGNLKFLSDLMEGLNYQPWISGAAQPKLTQERLLSIVIAVPPLEEQTAIADYLVRLTTPINTAMAKTRGEIELLEEYRSRLIADVVTGRVDVREVVDVLERSAV